jgi:beta-lactam-binding protein with PASTA domain
MTADHSVTATFAKKGKCNVPSVVGLKFGKARAKLVRAHCRVGKVTKRFSTRKKKGRVVAQRPRAGRTLPAGGKANLTVGKGPRKK